MDLDSKSDNELAQLITNHEKDATGGERPLYRSLLEERARRADARQLLKLDRSLEHLKQAAIAGRCTSYGALAAASGVAWSKARQQMNGASGHLERVLDVCHARGLPPLAAICVNQEGLATAELGEEALKGFVAGCERLGRKVEGARAFHRACVEACWEWGRLHAAAGHLT